MPLEERPREKLKEKGSKSLEDHELLSILLGSGQKNRSVGRLAQDLQKVLDREGTDPDIERITAICGIGPAKACIILAALEFSRRRFCPESPRISYPTDALPLLTHYAGRKQEHFLCLSLNGAHEVINIRVVSVGLVNRALVHPREIFADPIKDYATSIIVAHNHPSGNLEISREDREVTTRLKDAGDILGIKLLDHIVFTRDGYYSFLEEGEI